jgi:hypothetical protein
MQNIQDKDFDQFFKDKLSNAAVEPPAALWSNIEPQLQPKRKKFLPFYWMAAAVAVVAVTAGLLFTPEDKIQLQGKQEVTVTTIKPVQKAVDLPALTQETKTGQLETTVVKVRTSAGKHDAEKKLLAMQPIALKAHLNDITKTAAPVLEVAEPQIKAAVLTEGEVLIAQNNTPVLIKEEVITEVDQPEKKGIRNIGDLVNFVVEKVDKREQKFLKFKTDDDDNSSLVAINIGIIRLNAKDKAKR